MLQESRRRGKNSTTAIIQLLWVDKRRPGIPSAAIKLSAEKHEGILLLRNFKKYSTEVPYLANYLLVIAMTTG